MRLPEPPRPLPSPTLLRELREKYGWSQRWVGLMVNRTEQMISKYERGLSEIPLEVWKALLWEVERAEESEKGERST